MKGGRSRGEGEKKKKKDKSCEGACNVEEPLLCPFWPLAAKENNSVSEGLYRLEVGYCV